MSNSAGELPRRVLGRTGREVGIIGLGGYHVGTLKDIDEAARLVRAAIDMGVNFLDNAHCYHDGYSEKAMGHGLADGWRQKVFLMTKNHGRDGQTFTRQLHESLENLATDYLDLIQFHALSNDDEIEAIHAPGGALEAALKAREQGKVRFIGFTGHYRPAVHRAMIERGFPWDTCQLPANLLDARHLSFQQEVFPLLQERGIGIIGMKGLSDGKLLQAGVTVKEALRYALGLPVDVLVSGISSLEELKENVGVARDFQLLSGHEQAELMQRTAAVAATGELEWYKQEKQG